MVRICESSISSQFFDELNIRHERNLNNTPRTSFNCAGFALGTYHGTVRAREKVNGQIMRLRLVNKHMKPLSVQ